MTERRPPGPTAKFAGTLVGAVFVACVLVVMVAATVKLVTVIL